MKAVSIERMAARHLASVLEIERLSFSPPWSEASFMSEVEAVGGVPSVALAGGEVVGYVCARRVLDEGHLLKLAVRPAHRRRGIARALVESTVDRLRALGCGKLWLEVRASNEAARRIYEALGFRPAGTRKGYYESPKEDALVMALGL